MNDRAESGDDARDKRLAEALAEYWESRSCGGDLPLSALLEAYPDIRAELESAIQDSRAIDEILAFPAVLPPAVPDTMSAESLPAPPGYKILRRLGTGGMGQVWLAQDVRLDRWVAVKYLNPSWSGNPEIKIRFLEEARVLARLNHPGVVAIFQQGEESGHSYFVMEYLEGKPLTAALQYLPLEQKSRIFFEVLQVTAYLHRQGIVHRDLKPANILVDNQGKIKILDMGLARPVSDGSRHLTRDGCLLGTVDYCSPEQALGESIDIRSDVFSLGILLYEVLTGRLPFACESFREHLALLRNADPLWPRLCNPDLPRGIQDICLKALEKNPSQRYASAQEMADDLARFLAGEAVLAQPSVYQSHLSGKVERHLKELTVWHQEQLLSPSELSAFRRLYGRLIDREDAWIMEMRRLTLSQVALYLGGWLMAIASLLLVFFRFPGVPPSMDLLAVTGSAAAVFILGRKEWDRKMYRNGVAFLLTFTLLCLAGMLVVMKDFGWWTAWTQGREDLELSIGSLGLSGPTNTQVWWTLFLLLPVVYGLRRYTGATVFTLEMAFLSLLLSGATLLRMGLLDWVDKDPGRPFLYLLPVAAGYFLIGYLLEKSSRNSDSRYLHGHGVFLTYLSLSGIALFHEPYARWWQDIFPQSRGQVEYLFMINALIYWILQLVCEYLPSEQLHQVAKFFRFVIAGHVLTPLWILGIKAMELWQENPLDGAKQMEARIWEVLLPAIAALFVFYSIPRQMKNYLAVGMIFLAIGIIRLEKDLLQGYISWPLLLLLNGFLLMLAVKYSTRLKLLWKRHFG